MINLKRQRLKTKKVGIKDKKRKENLKEKERKKERRRKLIKNNLKINKTE